MTFSDPEVARVGVTEADAPPGSSVAYLPVGEVDRALTARVVDRAVTARVTDGFIKIVAAPRRVLRGLGGDRIRRRHGCRRTGPASSSTNPRWRCAPRVFTGRLAQTVYAYPTWSTAVQQVPAQFFIEIGGRRARPAMPRPPQGKE